MFIRGGVAWKRANAVVQASVRVERRRSLSTENGAQSGRAGSFSATGGKHKRESDKQFLISVLESSATNRDAKGYINTFGSSSSAGPKKTSAFTTVVQDGFRGQNEAPRFVQGPVRVSMVDDGEIPHIAIVKLKDPQKWDDPLLDGIARTITRLRDLGLRSVIVLDCDTGQGEGTQRQALSQQTDRVIRAIGQYGSPGAEMVSSAIWKSARESQSVSSVYSSDVHVGFGQGFNTPIRHGHIVVVPPRALCEETMAYAPADPNEVVFALAQFFSGLQVNSRSNVGERTEGSLSGHTRKGLVDRIIIIDPIGGIPANGYGDGARVFINLEEEFTKLEVALTQDEANLLGDANANHLDNLKLVKKALAILPSTASAVITSPAEAANLRPSTTQTNQVSGGPLVGEVKTRRWQNPLIHNLITDRPIYSASLPIGRVKPASRNPDIASARMPTTTLAKKGLPVTIFPDTRLGPWIPPTPGKPRLRLTDTCIDLPRLVHLIEDSFNRKLDVDHYLRRVEDSLAGIIIAGEYEGGAILTWERPFGVDEETAFRTGRLVPYLDKFAVLKKSQGAGGVADIVFNAMVRDCFPKGVCWRSRKNNPVNKWYFERSCGVRKLPESSWAMFWTTPEAATSEQLMGDYEDVCRNVVPSWDDTKPAD
ncbi:hypothetical protein B0J18DRAFT_392348 [Chaetomium sp. MPI-SDFR-AT-0129]|nr:hypothetical protein B0J18DRAFT_392348 [Chaetomium sp. MPI-SDFR-AT-0129]